MINTFELKAPDVNMDDGSTGVMGLDLEFLEKRRGQCESFVSLGYHFPSSSSRPSPHQCVNDEI